MKKAMRYAAAATACVLMTGCASENSTGLIRFFKEDYFEQATTTQPTTAATQITTTVTTKDVQDSTPPVEDTSLRLDDSGDTVSIYSFSNDVSTFLDGWEPSGAGVEFTRLDVDSYYSQLDSLLKNGKKDIDIFIVDQDHLPKYLSSDLVLAIDSIGAVDTTEMYYSTITDCTYDDELRALPLSLNPGVFLYNRTVARRALGTDDPDEVQRMLGSWDSFLETADTVKARGYQIMPNFTDMFRAFGGEAKRFTADDGEACVSDAAVAWVNNALALYEAGECGSNDIWSAGWAQGFTNQKYLGMFACNWIAEYTLPGMDDSGDWAVCRGPQAFSWDNNYALISARSDNMTDSLRVLERLCVNGDLHYSNGMIIPNNRLKFREDSLNTRLDPLGGQQPYSVYNEALNSIDTSIAGSAEDIDRSEAFVRAMSEYITGNCSFEQAMNNFYEQAQ